MKKATRLLFVDGLMHGGSSRTNPGEAQDHHLPLRPAVGVPRASGYEYSQALLDRLTPERARSSTDPAAGAGTRWIQHAR
jgi:hypothetical protein